MMACLLIIIIIASTGGDQFDQAVSRLKNSQIFLETRSDYFSSQNRCWLAS